MLVRAKVSLSSKFDKSILFIHQIFKSRTIVVIILLIFQQNIFSLHCHLLVYIYLHLLCMALSQQRKRKDLTRNQIQKQFKGNFLYIRIKWLEKRKKIKPNRTTKGPCNQLLSLYISLPSKFSHFSLAQIKSLRVFWI